MNIKEKLGNDLKKAMKENDSIRKDTIRVVLTSIKLAEVEKGEFLEEDEIIGVLSKELKNQQEALENSKNANRVDLIEENNQKIDLLNSYLPKPYSDDEIEEFARKVIQDTGAKGGSDMGKVMKILIPQLASRGRGEQVSRIVKELLQGN